MFAYCNPKQCRNVKSMIVCKIKLSMSMFIKNMEINFDSRPHFIAHQRFIKQEARTKPQDLNFWKIFSKMPRPNSLKQGEDKPQFKPNEEDEQLMMISAIKNTEVTCESPSKNIRVYKHQIKRYISDEGITFVRKINKDNFNSEQSYEKCLSSSPIQNLTRHFNPESSCEQQEIKSQEITQKRTIFSGNNNNNTESKFKYRITRDTSKNKRIIPGANSKVKLPELKEQKKYPVLMRNPEELKAVKSESYILVEYPSERVIVSNRPGLSLQIASLTKIMTFYVIYAIAEERGVDIKKEVITVTPEVNEIGGTSAELVEGQQYTVEELLYGLMLPSGNDAANELAYWAGAFSSNSNDPKNLLKAFVGQMNRYAKVLQLKNTKFGNPHGLPSQEARSTAMDLAKLCCVCMKIELFRNVTSCKYFKTTVKNGEITREVEWENTNKLLRRDGFLGLKTGITVTAGPCLAAAYNFRDKIYISVILRAAKVSSRFKETRLLLHWSLCKLYKDLSEGQKKSLKQLKKHNRQLDSDYSEDQQQFKYGCGDASEYMKRVNILTYEM